MAELLRDPESGLIVEKRPAKRSPCKECPWRRANWGATGTETDEFYTPERRWEMWDSHPERQEGEGVRHGSGMLCHQGAPPEFGGEKPGSKVAYPCPGSIVLQQRALLRFYDTGVVEHGSGLSVKGVFTIARQLFGPRMNPGWLRKLPREEVVAACHPALDDPAIAGPTDEPAGSRPPRRPGKEAEQEGVRGVTLVNAAAAQLEQTGLLQGLGVTLGGGPTDE